MNANKQTHLLCVIKTDKKRNSKLTFSLLTIQLYAPLNIFVALVGVVVWTEKNEIELSSDGDKTLKNFLTYRRKVLIRDHPNDNAQLLTEIQFEGGVVGKKRHHNLIIVILQIDSLNEQHVFFSTRQSTKGTNLHVRIFWRCFNVPQ